MRNRGIAVAAVVVLALGLGIWWWKHGGQRDTPATSTVTQPSGSATKPAPPAAKPAVLATLEVGVRDDNGPLANAAVRIAPDDGDVVLLATDASGTARAKLPAGTYQVSASARDHVPAAEPKELTAGQPAKVELVLAGGGRLLTGTVTDVSGGPIGGVRIDAAKLGGMARPSRAIASTTTAADGKYQVTVAEGQLLVAAKSADYAPQSKYVDVGPSGGSADFALVPGGVIEGIVLDDKTKQPVAGAAVDASRDRPALLLAEAGGHHAVAGEDGSFRLAGLPPGVYELDARGAGKRSKAPTVVGLGVAEQLSDVKILVGTGASVRGKVVDEAGAAVAGATVMTLGRNERDDDATADAAGAFAIDGVRPGKYVLIARGDAHVSAGMTPVEVTDHDVDGVIVRVQRGHKIRGHVEPRQIAEVALEPDDRAGRPMMVAPVTTKPDGEFELGPVVGGTAKLSARCPSGDQGSVEAAVPASGDVVIKVAPGGSIAGRVVDGTGKAVANATVMASQQGPAERTLIVNGMVTSGVQGLTNAAGAFQLVGLAPGTYRLGVLERGKPLRMRKQPAPVKLAAAETKTGVELAVDRPDGVIKGVVVGPDGKPLADAWVSLQQDLGALLAGAGVPRGGKPDGGPPGDGGSRMITIEARDDDSSGGAGAIAPALTDAQGRFEITGLAHTEYTVVAEAQAGKLRGRADDVAPDATLTIQALGVTSLSGTVKGPAGPPALFTVELDGPTRTQRSFTDGTFSLGRVDPGTYTVRVTSSDGNGEAKVTVAPNTPATVDIALVANAIVTGTLVDAAGKPLPDVGVVIVDDTGAGGTRISIEGPPPTTGPDGKFRVEHEAGPGALVVLVPPRPIIRKGLALEAGKTLDVGTVRVDAPSPPK